MDSSRIRIFSFFNDCDFMTDSELLLSVFFIYLIIKENKYEDTVISFP